LQTEKKDFSKDDKNTIEFLRVVDSSLNKVTEYNCAENKLAKKIEPNKSTIVNVKVNQNSSMKNNDYNNENSTIQNFKLNNNNINNHNYSVHNELNKNNHASSQAMNLMNKHFKENAGLKKFMDQTKKIDESSYDNNNVNNNINYCSADIETESNSYKYIKLINNKNIHKNKSNNNNFFCNKKPSQKTSALNRVNKSTDLDQHPKKYKTNLKEDFSINDLINKSNEDFIKMRKMLEKNSNKNSKKNLVNNNNTRTIQTKKEIIDIETISKDQKIGGNEDDIYINSNNKNYLDSGNRDLNKILDEKTFLKINNFNSKNYENARKKARNNFNKNNRSIPTEISEYNSNEAYMFVNTEVKNRPKSNLGGEYNTYCTNNYYKNANCIFEERINSIDDLSSSNKLIN